MLSFLELLPGLVTCNGPGALALGLKICEFPRAENSAPLACYNEKWGGVEYINDVAPRL